MTLEEFVAAGVREHWISEPGMKVYLRHRRYSSPASLDIIYVAVEPERRRKGLFKRFLTRMEDEARRRGMRVVLDHVENHHLAAYVETLGYERRRQDFIRSFAA